MSDGVNATHDVAPPRRRAAAPRVSPDAPGGRLRILFVVEGFFPSTGGAEMQARLLARSFASAGHAVRVVTARLDRSRPVRDTIDGIAVERIVYPRIPRVGALVLCARFAWKLWRERGTYDAIHVHTAKNFAAVAGLLRPWLGASLTVKISGAWEFEGGILDPQKRTRPLYRLVNRWIQRADTIQCISKYTYDRLIEAGYPAARVRMLPNAVDLTRFEGERRPHAGVVRVAYVGRLRRVKGVTVLLDAWHALPDRTGARLVVAGDGDLREELEAQVDRLSLRDTVVLAGEVSDVPAVLRDADVYVQPSFLEGLPNAVLEAMAAGLPIVATRVSGNEDLVSDGDNGLLVPPGDPAALAAALRRLIDDPALARRMGERSRARVAQFGIPAVTAQLARVYRRELA